MFRQKTPVATGVGAVAGAALMLAVGAWTPATAADFGEHVSTCTQSTGFSADHNPGMHQGVHGWDPTHTC